VGGIVYRENLNNTLACAGNPINKSGNIHKLAYAEIIFSSKGKYRNGGTCSAIARLIENICRMLAGEGAALYGAIYPEIFDFGLQGISMVMLPFGAGDYIAPVKHVCIIFYKFRRAIFNAYAPNVSRTPVHGIGFVAGDKTEPFAPPCIVFYGKCYCHICGMIKLFLFFFLHLLFSLSQIAIFLYLLFFLLLAKL
jgi:hypothetical protein